MSRLPPRYPSTPHHTPYHYGGQPYVPAMEHGTHRQAGMPTAGYPLRTHEPMTPAYMHAWNAPPSPGPSPAFEQPLTPRAIAFAGEQPTKRDMAANIAGIVEPKLVTVDISELKHVLEELFPGKAEDIADIAYNNNRTRINQISNGVANNEPTNTALYHEFKLNIGRARAEVSSRLHQAEAELHRAVHQVQLTRNASSALQTVELELLQIAANISNGEPPQLETMTARVLHALLPDAEIPGMSSAQIKARFGLTSMQDVALLGKGLNKEDRQMVVYTFSLKIGQFTSKTREGKTINRELYEKGIFAEENRPVKALKYQPEGNYWESVSRLFCDELVQLLGTPTPYPMGVPTTENGGDVWPVHCPFRNTYWEGLNKDPPSKRPTQQLPTTNGAPPDVTTNAGAQPVGTNNSAGVNMFGVRQPASSGINLFGQPLPSAVPPAPATTSDGSQYSFQVNNDGGQRFDFSSPNSGANTGFTYCSTATAATSEAANSSSSAPTVEEPPRATASFGSKRARTS